MKKNICELLESSGWNIRKNESAIAAKSVSTAAGWRESHVYIRSTSDYLILSAEYWSEGRNILSTADQWIHKNASNGKIKESVLKFLTDISNAINCSYAVSLLSEVIEIRACKRNSNKDVEQCSLDHAEFYQISAGKRNQPLNWLADFNHLESARKWAHGLSVEQNKVLNFRCDFYKANN